MRHIYLLFITLFLLLGCSETQPKPLVHKVSDSCTYYSLQGAECLEKEVLLKKLAPFRVIFVGDHHHSANAHQIMTDLIKGFSAKGYKIKMANEWFTPDDRVLLEQFLKTNLDRNSSKMLGWKKRVGYDYNLSQLIFKAVQEANGTLYGINMDKKFKTLISDANMSAMTSQQKLFYKTLDLNVSAHQQLLAPYFEHCHHLKKGETAQMCSERMYRVQVAWDSMMGRQSALLAQKLRGNEKLLVFVGAMHLEGKLGANMRFSRESHLPFVTILPYPKETESTQFIEIENGSSDFIYLYNED